MSNHTKGVDPYIQAQIQARSRPAVIKTRYLNFRTRYPEGLILAVEGNDDKIVYSGWIKEIKPELQYEFFVCGGKRGVRQLRNLTDRDVNTPSKQVLYLIDRDFDDLRGFNTDKDVFMLDRYSIENYIVSAVTLDASLKVAYPGDGEPTTRSAICRVFENDYNNFLSVSASLNYRIFVARRLGIDIDENMPNSLTDVAKVALGAVEASAVTAIQVLPFPSEPSQEQTELLATEFRTLVPAERYRGKYALKFFRAWLDCLAGQYRSGRTSLFPLADRQDGKIHHDEISLGSLASRCAPPIGLNVFILSAS